MGGCDAVLKELPLVLPLHRHLQLMGMLQLSVVAVYSQRREGLMAEVPEREGYFVKVP